MPKAIDDLYNTILRESRPILISHGSEQLTIRNVARICGVAVGTVYRYFDSKDALVAEILHNDWVPVMDRMRRSADSAGTPIDGLRIISDYIRDFIKVYANAWAEYRTIYRYSPALTKAHESFIQDISTIVHPMMQRFIPDYSPVVSDFLSRTVMAVSAEPENTFDELLPVLEKLCK